jgi:hypothetical protein
MTGAEGGPESGTDRTSMVFTPENRSRPFGYEVGFGTIQPAAENDTIEGSVVKPPPRIETSRSAVSVLMVPVKNLDVVVVEKATAVP